MHGIIGPDRAEVSSRDARRNAIVNLIREYRAFLFLVVAPTMLVACYYFLFAANQYESQADYVVRHAESPASSGAAGQLLGFTFGRSTTSPDAYLIEDYLLSHETVTRLRAEDELVARFRSPSADWISRLWFADPSPEWLLRYYRNQVSIEQDEESGISHLRVHAFTPADARHIAAKLLLLGEAQINRLNTRSFNDAVASAQAERDAMEKTLVSLQQQLTQFRRTRGDIDPEGTGKAQIGLVTSLTGDLVAARSRLNAMRGLISPTSPQYRALAAQIRALEAQVAAQSAGIAGAGASTAASLGDYEALLLRRDQAARQFAAASDRLESAKAQAARQQLYLVRVVDANMPVRSLYPERGKIVLTVLLGLALAYAIGWLIVAGIREHSL